MPDLIVERMIALKRLITSSWAIFIGAALSFAVANITNATIVDVLIRAAAPVAPGMASFLQLKASLAILYFIVPTKALVFFIGTGVLLIHFGEFLWRNRADLLKGKDLGISLLACLIMLALVSTFEPSSYGISYAKMSVDPFNQDVGHLYRRILLPGLANLYHFDGVYYIAVFWMIVFLTLRVTALYLRDNGIDLSLLEQASLLSIGIFASSFQFPGYPEILVLLLALVALIEFNRDGAVSGKQISLFALAMLSHESCAAIIFGPLALFVFGRKSWLPLGAVFCLYVATWLANFGFDIGAAVAVQTTVSGLPAESYFRQTPRRVLYGALYAFKLLWIFLPLACLKFWRVGTPSRMALPLITVILAIGVTYIAIDYTRMVGFATLAMLYCIAVTYNDLGSRMRKGIFTTNLLLPSFYAGGNTDTFVFKGIYFLAYGKYFGLTPFQ